MQQENYISLPKLKILTEWVVWATLDSKRDLELILLKGHLLVEVVLELVLLKQGIEDVKEISFYRKVCLLSSIQIKERGKLESIISILQNLNQLRNRLAHEHQFDIHAGDFELWSKTVLENFEGIKFTRYTTRTKIVHSFSILAKNMFDFSETT